MISGAQIREARELLGWSQVTLSNKAKIRPATLVRAESVDGVPDLTRGRALKIERVLKAAGVEFTHGEQPGVRLRPVL